MEEPVSSIFLVEDDPEDGCNQFLGNISICLTYDMVSQVLFITDQNKSMYDLIFQEIFFNNLSWNKCFWNCSKNLKPLINIVVIFNFKIFHFFLNKRLIVQCSYNVGLYFNMSACINQSCLAYSVLSSLTHLQNNL